jgi:hypothetical protein
LRHNQNIYETTETDAEEEQPQFLDTMLSQKSNYYFTKVKSVESCDPVVKPDNTKNANLDDSLDEDPEIQKVNTLLNVDTLKKAIERFAEESAVEIHC